ncbi:MAG: NifB/NifX family molybdenum-iron cluster-binding protein [Deltaproteobacteria bacterium]|nr:NifB/NifX family molybdenum-iron cluster-binding protein [Deltaproteobacteria bacterium]
MKICIPSSGTNLDSQIEPHFGRCAYFIFVEPESMEFEAVPNPNVSARGGAGVRSSEIMAQHGVHTVVSVQVGPKAAQVLHAAGIKIITVEGGTVREALEAFKNRLSSGGDSSSLSLEK